MQTDKPAAQDITLTGIIVPAEWDEGAKVVTIMLATNFEEEYLISDTGEGRALREHLNREVRVTGKVYEDKAGAEKYIAVHTYKVLK